MSDPKNPPEADKAKSRELTFAEAAKLVQRKVVELVDGKGADNKPAKVPREKRVAVKADEVLSFRDYDTIADDDLVRMHEAVCGSLVAETFKKCQSQRQLAPKAA